MTPVATKPGGGPPPEALDEFVLAEPAKPIGGTEGDGMPMPIGVAIGLTACDGGSTE